jgi:ubiquinone/menaquinone biosynthesis C-methylase UbiE
MDPADAAHRDVTRRAFARQAPSFERAGSIFRAADILEWIGAHVPVTAADTVLDVAGGTGQLARHMARTAAVAVVVDLTAEMLHTGARAARDAGDRNVVFVEGDATRLPLPDEQFDVVTCRFALHHIDDVAAAVGEMARVCRPGGTVAIIDMVAEPGEAGRRHNELERLRDPSHARAVEEPELIAVLTDAGVRASVLADRRQALPVGPWLDQSGPGDAERERVLAALHDEVDGGPPTGLHARRDDEAGLVIEHRWVIAGGVRR